MSSQDTNVFAPFTRKYDGNKIVTDIDYEKSFLEIIETEKVASFSDLEKIVEDKFKDDLITLSAFSRWTEKIALDRNLLATVGEKLNKG